MGLGLLLGALAVGALCCSSNNDVSVYDENNIDMNTLDNYISNYRSVYPDQSEKIEFLDDYR